MNITFLGTSSMMPTKERNSISILVQHEEKNILVDCGEGTQRQLKTIGISPSRIDCILLTHLHGDHILGLPGLLQTISATDKKQISIYGPKGIQKFLETFFHLFLKREEIKISITEIGKNGVFYESKNVEIEAREMKHTIPCIGYAIKEKDKRKINLEYTKKFGLTKHPLLGKLQQGEDIIYNNKKITVQKATTLKKGKKITIILDTQYTDECVTLAHDSDILICESTFSESLKEKAHEFKHLTAKQAAVIARKSHTKKLVLTHFSQRYKNVKEIEKEAKSVFKNTVCAKDFLRIHL